jgi:transposase
MPAPKKYDEETQDRAVRMYADRIAEGGVSQLQARREVGELLDINTPRRWELDPPQFLGEAGKPAVIAAEPADAELARLRRENAQLRRANEILKTASAFFAQAELDRGRPGR